MRRYDLNDCYFDDLKESEEGIQYVKNRKVKHSSMKNWKVSLGEYKDTYLENYLMIPFLYENKPYGYYTRSLRDKKFYTILPNENAGYKAWNLFNVNLNRDVYIFEGIFCAISSGLNSIALCGSSISEETLSIISNRIFCFDNDDVGRMKTKEYLRNNEKCFVCPSHIKEKDFNDLIQSGWTESDIQELIINNTFKGNDGLLRIEMIDYLRVL